MLNLIRMINMKNQISIIINGVRYDAFDVTKEERQDICEMCELTEDECECFYCCPLGFKTVFKKSDKRFEL